MRLTLLLITTRGGGAIDTLIIHKLMCLDTWCIQKWFLIHCDKNESDGCGKGGD